MAFPQDILTTRVRLWYDGQWNDQTSDVRGISAPGGRIRIGRGRPDEASQVRPTTCDLAFSNSDGKYTDRNTLSPLFGKLGRNTKLQVSVGEPHVGAPDDDTSASTSHVAPSVTAAKAGRLICAWAGRQSGSPFTVNYTVPGGMTGTTETDGDGSTMRAAHQSIGSAGATGTKTATASASSTWVAASVFLHGSSTTVQETLTGVGTTAEASDVTLTTGSGTQAGWWLVAIQTWAYFSETRIRLMPDAPQDDEGGWILLADTGISEVSTFHKQMRVWARRVQHAGAQAVTFYGYADTNLDNHANVYVVSGVDAWWVRATTEVPAWPATASDPSANDVYTPVQGAGVLRRLSQGRKPLYSALRRTIAGHIISSMDLGGGKSAAPVAYWPLEDGQDATGAASAITGVQPMTVTNGTISFAQADTIPGGSDVLPDLRNSTGRLVGRVPTMGTGWTNTTAWRLTFVLRYEGNTAYRPVQVNLTGGPWPELRVLVGSTIDLVGVDGSGTTTIGTEAVDLSDGRWYLFSLETTVTGGNVFYNVRVLAEDGTEITDTTIGSTAGTATGPPVAVTVLRRTNDTSASVGHVAVWAHVENEVEGLVDAAFDGYLNEVAGRRLERLCGEQMISFHPIGDLDDTPPMGPQRPGIFLDLIRECEAVDNGLLYEPRQEAGLAHRTRISMENQASALTLDYASNELQIPFNPTPDDALLRNDVTATRPDGGSARAVLEEGPLSIQEPPDGVGQGYDTQVPVNVPTDTDLVDQAGWRLHLGTIDETRYPELVIDLALLGIRGETALADSAATVDLGDLVQVENPPAWAQPHTIAQLAQGLTEVLSQYEWNIHIHGSPARPWIIGLVEDTELGRVDTDGSEVNTEFDAGTDTSLSVAITDGPLWTTDASGEFPNGFDIICAPPERAGEIVTVGVVLHVTAISGGSSPQTFTVSQTPVSGGNVTIPAGWVVRLADPMVLGM